MGRRKIEIKPIKDDRNRSVTFLKRKGGLFKKAHELSVLCQVDVAVIIFGQNKKLYQYCSGDIREIITRHQYYPSAHEHKGPADFADKGAADDEEESEDPTGSPAPEDMTPPMHGGPAQAFPNQAQFQQMQHAHSPSPSPPMQQNMFQPRLSVSQSGSRPNSRLGLHVRRTSSNLVPQDHPHPQAQQSHPSQPQYGYGSQYATYQHMPPPSNTQQMQMYQQQQQQQQQMQQQMQHQGHYSNPVPLHGQLQEMYLEEQRRQSLPPTFAMQIDPDDESGMMVPPQRPQRPYHSPPLSEQQHGVVGHKRTAQISFTPVEDTRNMMTQPWPAAQMQAQGGEYLGVKQELGARSQSIDVGSAMRSRDYGALQPPGPPFGGPGMRTVSVSAATGFGGHMRQNSLQNDLKRPRLTVQIPGEQQEQQQAGGQESAATESAGGSSTQGSGSGSATAGAATKPGFTRARGTSNVVLPPPSPRVKSPSSAGGVLSAGATGPKNPFARPPPPQTSMQPGSATQTFPYRENETPLSALPSRFMSGDLLQSPNTLYGEWGLGHINMASPATYQPTPITSQGPSWRGEEESRRRSSESSDRRG